MLRHPSIRNPKGETMADQQFLTPAQLAKSLQVSKRTLSRWTEEGRLPKPLRVAQTIRYPRAAIDAWAKQKQGGDR